MTNGSCIRPKHIFLVNLKRMQERMFQPRMKIIFLILEAKKKKKKKKSVYYPCFAFQIRMSNLSIFPCKKNNLIHTYIYVIPTKLKSIHRIKFQFLNYLHFKKILRSISKKILKTVTFFENIRIHFENI